jgi:hypothetical protein
MVWGTMPLGSLTGGLLGTAVGLRPTLVIAGLGGLLSVLWVLTPRVRTLDRVSDAEVESTSGDSTASPDNQ